MTNPGQGTNPSGGVPLINPLKAGTSIESFLGSILDFVIRIGSIIVILMTVFVGYKFVVAQGKPDKIEEAKKMLLWTIIGALVLIGAKVISAGILATVQALGG
jgi:heme/copper-type cytochrome/quinol oxidase subunit 2